MKHSNTKRLSWIFGLMMIFGLAAQPALATPTLTLESGESNYVGNEVSPDLFLTLDTGDSVFSADFLLSYDSSLLEFLHATVPSASDFLLTDNGYPPGSISLTLTPFGDLTGPNSFKLADLAFRIIGGTPGQQVDIEFTSAFIYDPNFDPIPSTSINNYITVTAAPVPEPATMLLLGSGLAGLGAMRSKRRQVATKKA